MAAISLTPTSFLVLGLVASVGAATPYELKQVVARSIGYFWPFPHSQLYAEPARLATAGLLDEEQEEGGRRRRTYTITPAGRAALGEWLAEPTGALTEIRDLSLLKLFFGDLAGAEQVVALARACEEVHRSRLAEYEDLYRRVQEGVPPAMVATLRMGLQFEQMAIDFWTGIATDPPVEQPARSEERG